MYTYGDKMPRKKQASDKIYFYTSLMNKMNIYPRIYHQFTDGI